MLIIDLSLQDPSSTNWIQEALRDPDLVDGGERLRTEVGQAVAQAGRR